MTNTNADAWRERTPLNGVVDFTMMYVAHDAFTRDLRRLAAAGEQGAHSPQWLGIWATFTKQLHIHHTGWLAEVSDVGILLQCGCPLHELGPDRRGGLSST